jgi:hypothetical protein
MVDAVTVLVASDRRGRVYATVRRRVPYTAQHPAYPLPLRLWRCHHAQFNVLMVRGFDVSVGRSSASPL